MNTNFTCFVLFCCLYLITVLVNRIGFIVRVYGHDMSLTLISSAFANHFDPPNIAAVAQPHDPAQPNRKNMQRSLSSNWCYFFCDPVTQHIFYNTTMFLFLVLQSNIGSDRIC